MVKWVPTIASAFNGDVEMIRLTQVGLGGCVV